MRVLFLTNFYPPHELGGQGRSCLRVVEGMRARGHQTLVLTSMHGVGYQPQMENGVARRLQLEMDFVAWRNSITFFTERRRREQYDVQQLEGAVAAFNPDVLFVWGMWNLPRAVPLAAERLMGDRVLYRFAEYWPTLPSQYRMYWESAALNRLNHVLKTLLRPLAFRMLAREAVPGQLRFPHAFCVSASTRRSLLEKGIPVHAASVVHTGLDPAPFLSSTPEERNGGTAPVRLLYAGRLTASKGVHTMVGALARLKAEGVHMPAVTIAGSGEAAYEARLRDEIAKARLEATTTFVGQISPQEMPALYRAHDVLVVPSVWPEPFARVILEGMAAGLVVLASRAGGSVEALEHGHTGLLFEPDDIHDQVEQLRAAISDPQLRLCLGANAQRAVIERFTEERMLASIEELLKEAADA